MRLRSLARWLLTCVVWLAVSFVVWPARAESFGASASIEAGREREVLALFAPMTLGGDVTPGWRLMNVAVESRFIRVGVVGPAGARGTLVLDHPSRASGPRTSKSFVMQPDPADASTPGGAALARLMDAVVENDAGGFFRMSLPPTKHEGGEIARRMRGPVLDWITDGVVLLTALCLLVGVLAWRELAGQPRWMTWALIGVLALSLLLRTTISVEAALDVWPFSRVLPIARLAFNGPVLAWVSRRFGATFPLTDVVFTTNLVVAIVSPLAMFTHARPLLRDPRLALAAVAIFAVAPGHIRFSHSDTAFIPALALSSVTFGLVHRAVRDESRWFRAGALVVLPVLQLCTLATRPLNILFLPLYFVQLFVLDDSKAPIARRAVVAAITTVVGVGFFFSSFLVEHEGTIVQSVDLGLPLRVVGALFKPRLNTLLHPWVTPPVLTLLAVFGVVVLFRKQERRRAWFLMGWAFLFFAGHAVVLPSTVEMQSRYQLHLIVPVAMLAAIGLFELFARRRRLGIAAVVVLAASPLLHLGFERDVAFNDMREFAFARAATREIPDGCTVLEALEGDHDARFTRMGLAIEAGSVHQRFRVQPLNVPGGEALREEARAVLANPPACLVYYEGLPCRFVKAREEPISRACAAAAASVPWSVVSEVRFPSRPYDENLTKGFGPTERDLALREQLHAPRARRKGRRLAENSCKMSPVSEPREGQETTRDVDALGATEVIGSASDTTPSVRSEPTFASEPTRGTVVLGERVSSTKVSPVESAHGLRPFGPYTSVEELSSQGAMGIVARAYNASFDRWELVKFLRQEHAERAELVRQFEREGKVLARLAHPNVVTVFAVYEQGGRPCLAMEFLDGESLGDLVERDGPLSPERGLELFLDAARGLAAAHDTGLFHRDLKPDNLFVVAGKKGSPVGLKLIDFGLATADRTAAVSASSPQLIADITGGTPLYMAPEQWRGGEGTASTDLFALGLSFYVALAGRLPFDAASTDDVRRAMMSDEPFTDVRVWKPGVPRALAEVLARAIDKSPDGRFASAEELVTALVAARASARPRRVPGSGPYRGLMTFSAAERDVFFGRDTEVAEIVERLRREPGIVVVGPSGAGKSSLVHAGVVPSILDGALGSGLVFVEARFEPRERPLASLAAALARALGKNERELYSFLVATPTGLGAALVAALPPPRALLVVVDQLEELATLATDPGEVAAFSRAVGSILAAASPSLRVVATVRADLLDRLFSQEPLRALLTRGFHPVRPLRGEALRRAVLAPAEAAGYTVEDPSLVDEIVKDADKTDAALPLVSFVMASWWALRDEEKKLLPTSAYLTLGGLSGALARHGDALFDAMSERERSAAEAILVRLVSSAGTRIRVDLRTLLDPAAIGPAAQAAFTKLSSARLVVESAGKVEIVHESLAVKWPRLAALLQVSGEDRAYRDRVSAAAREWEGQGRPEGMLWSGELAERLFRWVEDTAAPLGQSELAFYEEVRRRRDRRRLVSRSAIISITLALVFVTLIAKRSERDLSERLVATEAIASAASSGFRRSEARLKRAEAAAKLADDPAGALLLAHESWELHHDSALDVLAWQARALGVPRPLPPHPRGPVLVAISANGAWLASAGSGGSVHVLSATKPDHASFRASAAPYGMPRALMFSPDGALFAVGTSAGEIVVAEEPAWKPQLVGRCNGEITNVVVSGGAVFAACPRDDRGAVRVAPKTREIAPLAKGKVTSFSIADDADVGVWLTEGGAVGLFAPSSGQAGVESTDAGKGARIVALAPQGKALALGRADGALEALDVDRTGFSKPIKLAGRLTAAPHALVTFDDHETITLSSEARDHGWRSHTVADVRALGGASVDEAWSFSRRKRAGVIAGRSGDATIRSLIDGADLGRLRGASLDVTSVAIDAHARLAVVGARDGGVRVYALDEVAPLLTRPRSGGGWGCALSPDGAAAACSSRVGVTTFGLDGSVGGATAPRAVASGDAPPHVLAVSPRGEHVATAVSGEIRVDGAPLADSAPFQLGAYSPDGSQVALAGRRDKAGKLELRRMGATKSVDLSGPPNVLLWSRDGDTLLVGLLSGGIAIVDALAARVVRTVELNQIEGDASAIALTDDGAQIAASGTSGKVVVVRTDGTRERLVAALGAPIACLAFSQDGRVVVAGSTGARHLVVDVDGGGTFQLAAVAPITGCARSPIGDRFSFVGNDGSAWIRALDFAPLVAERAPDSALDATAVSVETWRGLGWK